MIPLSSKHKWKIWEYIPFRTNRIINCPWRSILKLLTLKFKFQASYSKSFIYKLLICNSFIVNRFFSCFLKADHFPFWERVLIKTWQTSFENETTWLEQVSEVFPILHTFPFFLISDSKKSVIKLIIVSNVQLIRICT